MSHKSPDMIRENDFSNSNNKHPFQLLERMSHFVHNDQQHQGRAQCVREICDAADNKDPYSKSKPFGIVHKNPQLAQVFLRNLKSQKDIFSKFQHSKFYSLEHKDRIFMDFVEFLQKDRLAETISKSQNIKDPVLTDIQLSISNGSGYGADMWHRDGPLGKRIKIFFILFADPQYCCNLGYAPFTYDLPAEPTYLDSIHREDTPERWQVDSEIEEYFRSSSSQGVQATDYRAGDIFFFNTNMYHKRLNREVRQHPMIVNRIALVAQIISESRLSLMDQLNTPSGKYRLKVF